MLLVTAAAVLPTAGLAKAGVVLLPTAGLAKAGVVLLPTAGLAESVTELTLAATVLSTAVAIGGAAVLSTAVAMGARAPDVALEWSSIDSIWCNGDG